MFGSRLLSSSSSAPLADERRDVDRDRERHVVAAAVVAELRVRLSVLAKKSYVTLMPYFFSKSGIVVLADVPVQL